LSSAFFYDPFIYRSKILNYQFNVLITPITLIPFSLIFVSLSIHYGKLLIKTAGKSKNYKYLLIALGVTIEALYVSVILAAHIKLCLWDIGNKQLYDALRVVIAVIYCFDVVMFLFRTAFFVKKLMNLSNTQSDNASKKKKKYIILSFWLILISFSYILTFSFNFILTFDAIYHKIRLVVISTCFFYFGIAVCCFGLMFLFKPKVQERSNSSFIKTNSKSK
jgi:hypothetical protein